MSWLCKLPPFWWLLLMNSGLPNWRSKAQQNALLSAMISSTSRMYAYMLFILRWRLGHQKSNERHIGFACLNTENIQEMSSLTCALSFPKDKDLLGWFSFYLYLFFYCQNHICCSRITLNLLKCEIITVWFLCLKSALLWYFQYFKHFYDIQKIS